MLVIFYAYRLIVIDTETEKVHYLDLYKNNEMGGNRISNQKDLRIIYYDVERFDKKLGNDYLSTYKYSKNEFDLISGISKTISKGVIPNEMSKNTDFDPEEYFSQLENTENE